MAPLSTTLYRLKNVCKHTAVAQILITYHYNLTLKAFTFVITGAIVGLSVFCCILLAALVVIGIYWGLKNKDIVEKYFKKFCCW